MDCEVIVAVGLTNCITHEETWTGQGSGDKQGMKNLKDLSPDSELVSLNVHL